MNHVSVSSVMPWGALLTMWWQHQPIRGREADNTVSQSEASIGSRGPMAEQQGPAPSHLTPDRLSALYGPRYSRYPRVVSRAETVSVRWCHQCYQWVILAELWWCLITLDQTQYCWWILMPKDQWQNTKEEFSFMSSHKQKFGYWTVPDSGISRMIFLGISS